MHSVLTEIRTNRQIPPERTMARAVVSWQSQEHEEALRYFGSAVGAQPEWENSNWVRALYSSRVAESVVEMQTKLEQQKARVAVNR